jgi:hypothetical protein
LVEPFSNPGLPSTWVVVPPPPAAVTVTDTVALWVIPPPLPFTVTLNVPVGAVLLAEKVSVELPLPGAAMEPGLKLAVTPVGNAPVDSATAALNPPKAALDMVVARELP